MPSSAYISLGSNQGDRTGYLLLAVRGMLDARLNVFRLSRIYQTEPVDVSDQAEFLNMVAELRGELPPPEQLLALLLQIEHVLGRTRELLRGPRNIDLDLLCYDDQVIQTEFLTLPHPRLHLRRFVLVPLAELAPDLKIPTQNATVNKLLTDLNDHSQVQLWHPTPNSDPAHEI
jgi:2-amino-4-hydroxy-6-hydroxymethyldihydropteridine diphosphokinase